jgi:hypothetical protein
VSTVTKIDKGKEGMRRTNLMKGSKTVYARNNSSLETHQTRLGAKAA